MGGSSAGTAHTEGNFHRLLDSPHPCLRPGMVRDAAGGAGWELEGRKKMGTGRRAEPVT